MIAERGRAQALKVQLIQNLSEQTTANWTQELTPSRIQEIAIDHEATIISYSVLWNKHILIWVIQPDGTLTFRQGEKLDLNDTNIYSGITASRGRGVTVSDFVDLGTLNRVLERSYESLIAPIEDLLPEDENESVIFIPYQDIVQVPLVALRNPGTGEYLIENHTISVAPSILSLALTQVRQEQLINQGSGALIMGNPTLSEIWKMDYRLKQLPGAEAEALKVADFLDTSTEDVLLNDNATKSAVIERLSTARYIHLATHG